MWAKIDLDKAMIRAIETADASKTPFAAALVDKQGNIVLEAVNTSQKDGPLAHAEMNLLREAIQQKLPIEKMCLISTCEPCPMCAGAMIWSHINYCGYGVSIEQASKYLKQIDLSAERVVQSGFGKIVIIGGIHADKALSLFENYS
jgi:tRNA(Arg) A34 adenosine deaminase TadA